MAAWPVTAGQGSARWNGIGGEPTPRATKPEAISPKEGFVETDPIRLSRSRGPAGNWPRGLNRFQPADTESQASASNSTARSTCCWLVVQPSEIRTVRPTSESLRPIALSARVISSAGEPDRGVQNAN